MSKKIEKESIYPEVNDIREDINSLKTNVLELTQHIKRDGKAQTDAVSKAVKNRLDALSTSAEVNYKKAEDHIKAQPGRSVAIAFAAGLAASILLRRR